MTFRKKVKKILSKLTSSRGKSNKASSSAPVSELSTSRPGTTTTINPANPPGEIFPRRPSPPSPPTPPNNPPKNYSFPKGVHPSYRPPGIIDQDNPDENRAVLSSYHDHSRLVPEEERGPYIRDFDEGTRRRGRGQRHKLGEGGSPYIRDFDEGTRSRGRPGTSAYPEEVSERYHSSEYDRKAISQYSPIDRPKSRKSFSNSLASSDYDHHCKYMSFTG